MATKDETIEETVPYDLGEDEPEAEIPPEVIPKTSQTQPEEEEWVNDPTKRKIEGVVKRYTLINVNGVAVQIINYGSTITSIKCPDKNGDLDDVVLGFETIEKYRSEENQYFGATIGRVAGVISNAEYSLRGRPVYLTNNLVDHHFHGGFVGFDKVMWDSYVSQERDRVVMSYLSEDGAECYPGNALVQIAYTLTQTDRLQMEITAQVAKPTPLSITNHSYFNLAGHWSGPGGLKEHCLVVNADKYVVADLESHVPTGELKNVGGTYYDLRVPRSLEVALDSVPGGGYDQTFCLTKGADETQPAFAARLVHPDSGRYLEIETDYPGLHLYTADGLPNVDLPPDSQYRPPPNPIRVMLDKRVCKPRRSFLPRVEWPKAKCTCIPKEVVYSVSRSNLEDLEMWERLEGQEGPDRKTIKLSEDGSRGLDERASFYLEPLGEDEPLSACAQFLLANRDDAESDVEEYEVPGWIPPKEIVGKMDSKYRNQCAICLMPQEYPDAVNHRRFPNPIVYPGKPFSRRITFKFGVVRLRTQWVPPEPQQPAEEGEFDEMFEEELM